MRGQHLYLASVAVLFALCSGAMLRPSRDAGPYPSISATSVNPTNSRENGYIIGTGYNIFKGNPDGELWSKGGEDPGILLTKRILKTDSKDTHNQIEISQRHGCQPSHEYDLVYSPKSYQDKLNKFITIKGIADTIKPYAFTLSSGFKALSHQTVNEHYVFQDYTAICSLGSARYKSSLAGVYQFPLSDEFAVDLCALPDQYVQSPYMQFLEKWGTHVITETDFGERLTNRYRAKLNNYINYIVQNVSDVISAGGPLNTFPDSLTIDMNQFQFRQEFHNKIGSLHDTVNIGGSNFYEDIKLVLSPMTFALADVYWPSIEVLSESGICFNKTSANMGQWRQNIARAITEYPTFKRLTAATDYPLAVPITWPNGTYTLAKPLSGCPADNTSWSSGYRYEETDRQDPDSTWTPNNHFDASLFSSNFTLWFCTKYVNHSTVYDIDWQKGDYCLYKYGPCPTGFSEGSLFVDDEDTTNHNSVHGAVPDGVYDRDTVYKFCCRSDGSYSNPIYLPTTNPFYLFKYKYGCQQVHDMMVTEEFLEWDIEDSHTRIHSSGVYPAGVYSSTIMRLIYCYYTPVTDILPGPVIG